MAGDGSGLDEIIAFHMPVAGKDKMLTGLICIPLTHAVTAIVAHEAAHAVFWYLDEYPGTIVEEENFCYPLGRVCGRISEELNELFSRTNTKVPARSSLNDT